MNKRRRVVVTGMGAMTPLGLTLEETWEGLLAGRSGVGPITQFDASGLPVRIAGELKDFDPTRYINFKAARRMARCSQVAIAMAQAALADAGLSLPLADEERVGVLVGSAVGGLDHDREVLAEMRPRLHLLPLCYSLWGRLAGMIEPAPQHPVHFYEVIIVGQAS